MHCDWSYHVTCTEGALLDCGQPRVYGGPEGPGLAGAGASPPRILQEVGRAGPVGPLAQGSRATQRKQRKEAGNPARRPSPTCPPRFDLMTNCKLSKVGAVWQRPPPACAVCSVGHASVLGAFPVCTRAVRTCGGALTVLGSGREGAHGSAAGRHVTTPSC